MNRILLVDDEIYINLLFRIVLEDRGFKVDTFEDPITALEKI
jgi:DNA-binding response OmpR family regulator